MISVYRRFEKAARYYELIVMRDLLDDLIILRVNGRKNSRLGHIKNLPINNPQEAMTILTQLSKRRLLRGYVLVKSG